VIQSLGNEPGWIYFLVNNHDVFPSCGCWKGRKKGPRCGGRDGCNHAAESRAAMIWSPAAAVAFWRVSGARWELLSLLPQPAPGIAAVSAACQRVETNPSLRQTGFQRINGKGIDDYWMIEGIQ